MNVSIMQPYVFPYLGYFQLIYASDVFIIYDDVSYIKGGWINRNNILLGGEKHLFTIPLSGASGNKKINTVSVVGSDAWRKKLMKTIEAAYRRAPNYEKISNLCAKVFYSSELISELAQNGIIATLDYLGIKKVLKVSSIAFSDTQDLKGQDRVSAICMAEAGTCYINPIGGRDLYSHDHFNQNGIDLRFLNGSQPRYQQGITDFIPGLSIIDVLMFNEKDRVVEMLKSYELIK